MTTYTDTLHIELMRVRAELNAALRVVEAARVWAKSYAGVSIYYQPDEVLRSIVREWEQAQRR